MRKIISPLRGFESPLSAAALSIYAVNNFDPALVFDFDDEYYRTSNSTTTFETAISHNSTSTTNGTMVDSDGLLKWRPHNLLTYSEQFDNAAWVETNARATADAAIAPDGTATAYTLTDDAVDDVHFIAQNNVIPDVSVKRTPAIWVKGGTLRYVTFTARPPNGTNTQWNSIFDTQEGVWTTTGTTGVDDFSATDAGNGWWLISFSDNTISTAYDNICVGTCNGPDLADQSYSGSGGTIYIWGAHAYRSDLGGMVNNPDRGDSYVPTTTAARYLPRRGHHVYNGSTWVNEGLLVESEARTNLITQSNAFTTTWTDSNATPASAAATGPDGETSMWNLVDDGSTGTGEVYLDFAATVAVDTTYTFSAYVKASDLSWCALGTENFTTPGNVETYFDLSTGAVGTEGTGHTANISDDGGGIYRVSITFTTDSSDTSGNVRIYVADADTDNTVDLDGTSSIYVYGAQLELGSTPSSYIPTSGVEATRGAETLTVAAADLPYDSTNMSIQMDGRMTYADENISAQASGDGSQVDFAVWKVDSSNYISLQLETFGGAVTGKVAFLQENTGILGAKLSANAAYSPGILVPYNISSRHGSTFINGAVDGTALTADTTPTGLPDLSATDLNLGYDYMGTIRTFRMWDDDLGDTGIEEASVTKPLIFGVPTISGNTNQGATLTATSAPVVIGEPTPSTTWQWLRDGAPISGATSSTYTLVGDDVGSKISVRQTETNVGGSSSATSAETATISAVPALAIAQRDSSYILDRANNYIELRG